MNKLAERFKELRTHKKISQSELAEYINIKRNSISRWETGSREPSIDDIIKLCKFFETSSDYLIGIED